MSVPSLSLPWGIPPLWVFHPCTYPKELSCASISSLPLPYNELLLRDCSILALTLWKSSCVGVPSLFLRWTAPLAWVFHTCLYFEELLMPECLILVFTLRNSPARVFHPCPCPEELLLCECSILVLTLKELSSMSVPSLSLPWEIPPVWVFHPCWCQSFGTIVQISWRPTSA